MTLRKMSNENVGKEKKAKHKHKLAAMSSSKRHKILPAGVHNLPHDVIFFLSLKKELPEFNLPSVFFRDKVTRFIFECFPCT